MVDFAYHVHTDVGNTMKGAKVNGKLVPNNHELQNAEVVEIVTYGTETTAQDVLRHMVRASAWPRCPEMWPCSAKLDSRVSRLCVGEPQHLHPVLLAM